MEKFIIEKEEKRKEDIILKIGPSDKAYIKKEIKIIAKWDDDCGAYHAEFESLSLDVWDTDPERLKKRIMAGIEWYLRSAMGHFLYYADLTRESEIEYFYTLILYFDFIEFFKKRWKKIPKYTERFTFPEDQIPKWF